MPRRSDVSIKHPIGGGNTLGREAPMALGARRRTYGAHLPQRPPSGPTTWADALAALDEVRGRFDSLERRFDAILERKR
jgi:hypothetical protein